MACGNNHVTRAYLASSPVRTPVTVQSFFTAGSVDVKTSRQELGERGEALVAQLLVEAQQHELVYQHTPGERPQGVDVVTLDPDGRLVVTEVKSTAAETYKMPHTTQNVGDHQLDQSWTSKNLTATGLVSATPDAVGPAADQVSRQIAQFDAASGTVSFWDVTDGGQRSGNSPTEVWDVDRGKGSR